MMYAQIISGPSAGTFRTVPIAVIEPDGAFMRPWKVLTPIFLTDNSVWHEQFRASCGKRGSYFLSPDDVSFQNIRAREGRSDYFGGSGNIIDVHNPWPSFEAVQLIGDIPNYFAFDETSICLTNGLTPAQTFAVGTLTKTTTIPIEYRYKSQVYSRFGVPFVGTIGPLGAASVKKDGLNLYSKSFGETNSTYAY